MVADNLAGPQRFSRALVDSWKIKRGTPERLGGGGRPRRYGDQDMLNRACKRPPHSGKEAAAF
jgi:hypothetical protein